jgi:hypothetical protein
MNHPLYVNYMARYHYGQPYNTAPIHDVYYYSDKPLFDQDLILYVTIEGFGGNGWYNSPGAVMNPRWFNPFSGYHGLSSDSSQYKLISPCVKQYNKYHYIGTSYNWANQMQDLQGKMGVRWVWANRWGPEEFWYDFGDTYGVYNPRYGFIRYYNQAMGDNGWYGDIVNNTYFWNAPCEVCFP